MKSSAKERRHFTSIACDSVVLYLKITEQLLVARSSNEEEKQARSRFRLDDLQWSMQRPRLMMIGSAACEADDTMDFMLGLCMKTADECLKLVQQAKSGNVGVNMETNTPVSGRSLTWDQHATDFWTLVVHDITLHLEALGSYAQCIQNVRAALSKPPPSSTRSWPAKKTFTELKKTWERLGVEDRIRMTTLSSNEFWFVQACDTAVATETLAACKRRNLRIDIHVLVETFRKRSGIIASLSVIMDPIARIEMNANFVMNPRCLDEIYNKSVRHTAEKVEMVRSALCCRYEGLFQEGAPKLAADSSSTWADVERVVATLVLECMLQRFTLMNKTADFVIRNIEEAAYEAREAAQRKREKQKAQKAKRREAEKEKMMVEVEMRKVEEARERSEMERRTTLVMLSKAPSWDISCLGIYRTFLHYREVEAPVFAAKDW
jgi:hypothetical protein